MSCYFDISEHHLSTQYYSQATLNGKKRERKKLNEKKKLITVSFYLMDLSCTMLNL